MENKKAKGKGNAPGEKTKKVSKYLFLIDPGHGGLINGKYTTPGKRSPVFPDGFVLYEGVNNRDNAKRLVQKLKFMGLDAVDIVDSEQDISLGERVRRANNLNKKKKTIYISLHSDGAGNGREFHPGKGSSVFTSVGQTKSDVFAEIAFNKLKTNFGDSILYRRDLLDGDSDKEAHFYVLKNTAMPALRS